MPILCTLTTINILVRNKQDILLGFSLFPGSYMFWGWFSSSSVCLSSTSFGSQNRLSQFWVLLFSIALLFLMDFQGKNLNNFNHVLHTMPASGVKRTLKANWNSAWSKMARCPSRWEWVILEKEKGVVLRKMGPGASGFSRGLISVYHHFLLLNLWSPQPHISSEPL